MILGKTSATALIAVGIIAGTGAAASACDWQKQVQANATAPAVEEQAATASTPVDPMLLAKTESPETEKTVKK